MKRPAATRLSELLFGRGCRLAVALYALTHPKGRFYQSEPPAFGTTSSSNIRNELKRLVAVGLLDEERADDKNKVYYVRVASPLWKIVAVAASETGLRWEDGRLIEGEPYVWNGWPLDD